MTTWIHKCRFCKSKPHWIITWSDGESQWAGSWERAWGHVQQYVRS